MLKPKGSSNKYEPETEKGITDRNRHNDNRWGELPNDPDGQSDNYTEGSGNIAAYDMCPDKRWYFDLYIRCVAIQDSIFKADIIVNNSADFTVYSDYLGTSMMFDFDDPENPGTSYDPTIYELDGSYGRYVISLDSLPEQPLLFKHPFGKVANKNLYIPQLLDDNIKWDALLPINKDINAILNDIKTMESDDEGIIPENVYNAIKEFEELSNEVKPVLDAIKDNPALVPEWLLAAANVANGAIMVAQSVITGVVMAGTTIDATYNMITKAEKLAENIQRFLFYSMSKEYRTDSRHAWERSKLITPNPIGSLELSQATIDKYREANSDIRVKYGEAALDRLYLQTVH